MPAWAMISCGSYASISRASASAIGGRPRPPWIRIGTPRSAASSNTGASRSSSSRNFCARGCSLIPPAPRSRQRVASSIGLSARSSRTNGTSSPPLRSAKASVRSFGARKPGCRSGSSRQNMNERVIPCARWIRSSSSRSPRMPSMSVPRWTCASKISASGGSSARTSSSNLSTRPCARRRTSSTSLSLRTAAGARFGWMLGSRPGARGRPRSAGRGVLTPESTRTGRYVDDTSFARGRGRRADRKGIRHA